MSSGTRVAATLEDLYRVQGKAELISGRIVHQMPTGFRPGRVGARIFRSLDDHAEATGRGVALPDNVGFAVPILSSGRQSFSPDASYYLGPLPANPMRFIDGPPTFAVEVRSEGDYGDAA
jgi:Uma2 family endonuclease